MQRLMLASENNAAQGADIAVIATPGDRDVANIRGGVVCGIEIDVPRLVTKICRRGDRHLRANRLDRLFVLDDRCMKRISGHASMRKLTGKLERAAVTPP